MESMLAWNEGFLFLHSVCIIFQASDILYLQHCSFLFVMRASLRWKMLCPQPVTLKCPNARLLNIFREKSLFQLLYLPLVFDLLLTIYKPQSCQHKTCLKTQKPISNLSPEQKYKNRKNKNHHKGCFKLQLNQCANCYMFIIPAELYLFFIFK